MTLQAGLGTLMTRWTVFGCNRSRELNQASAEKGARLGALGRGLRDGFTDIAGLF